MQRDAIKPPFQKARKRDSLLPSVVVLPKIGGGRGEERNKNLGFRPDVAGFDQTIGSSSSSKKATKSTVKESSSPVDVRALDRRSAIALPPTPARASLVEGRRMERKSKKEQDLVNHFEARNRSISTVYDNHGTVSGKYSNVVQENALFENVKGSSEVITGAGTFENPAVKDFWHHSRNREPGLIRRESCCSSCGGALSYTNSFASTRRFSAVSIEIPNENVMKKSIVSRNPSIISGDSLRNMESSFTTTKRADSRKLIKTRSEHPVVSKTQFDKIERQKNLLYDLISVLYNKNFIKEDVRPYVQHALKICSNDVQQ